MRNFSVPPNRLDKSALRQGLVTALSRVRSSSLTEMPSTKRDGAQSSLTIRAPRFASARDLHFAIRNKVSAQMHDGTDMKKYNATILLVDDDVDFLMFVERAFRQNGVTSPIHKVHDGAEAIAYMMGEGKYADRKTYEYPTFIMTDLKMPRADGYTVLQHLKGNPEWAIIPTVVFSSSADLDDIKKSYMLGASSYHVKPPSMGELRQRLDILHKYWMTCETPEVDASGRQRRTDSGGKLGDRFQQATGSAAQVSAPREDSPDHTAEDSKWNDRTDKRD